MLFAMDISFFIFINFGLWYLIVSAVNSWISGIFEKMHIMHNTMHINYNYEKLEIQR